MRLRTAVPDPAPAAPSVQVFPGFNGDDGYLDDQRKAEADVLAATGALDDPRQAEADAEVARGDYDDDLDGDYDDIDLHWSI